MSQWNELFACTAPASFENVIVNALKVFVAGMALEIQGSCKLETMQEVMVKVFVAGMALVHRTHRRSWQPHW
jgi:hypothetical protein